MVDSNRIISARQIVLNPDGTFQTPWFRFFSFLAEQTGGNFQLVFDELVSRATEAPVAGPSAEGLEAAAMRSAMSEAYPQMASEDALALASLHSEPQTSRETVTGSRAGNAALASLLTGLSRQGTIQDASTP